ncbi:MAG: DUF3168 domain-containing protein [Pirellulaceae bacterium]
MIEQDFYTAISSVAGGRVYPTVAPQDADYPMVVYQRISTARFNSVDGDQAKARVRFQVSCWGMTYADAKNTAAAIKTAVRGSTLTAVTDSEQDGYEDGDRIYRANIDFLVMGED